MTKLEEIKTFNAEEMADFLLSDEVLKVTCSKEYCPHYDKENDGGISCTVDHSVECKKATVKWLNSEVK